MYVTSLDIHSERFPVKDVFPFNVRALNSTSRIEFAGPITFLTGANGTGKSALLDAMARKSGFLPWGGSKVHSSHKNPFENKLAGFVSLGIQTWRPYGFHFRAEAFFNFAASLDDIIIDDPGRETYYGGKSLNVLSHGESFLAFFGGYSFQLDGLYMLDEPEAALSPENQLEFVKILRNNAASGKKQYIIATLSPIILACPGSQILSFDNGAIQPIRYEECSTYRFYKEFIEEPGKFLV
ncbi:MAG: family ATPase [Thermodesulfobacteriota bacterium]|nr:family ATPase [Thermodesulfobacteriota bacterium]